MRRYSFLLLLAATLACGGDSSGPSGPSYLGRILFVAGPTGLDGQSDIYSIRPNGTGLRKETDFPAYYYGLAPSPDGKRVYFVRGAAYTGPGEIYVLEAGETVPVPVTASTGRETRVSIRRDGDRLVFLRDGAVFTMNTDGSNITQVPGITASSVAWTPDGNLLYGKATGSPTFIDLYRISPTGTGDTPVVASNGDDRDARFLSGGSRFVYTHQISVTSALYRRSAAGADPDTLTIAADFWASEPTVSPRGDTIAFARVTNATNYGTLHLRLPNGTFRPVTSFGDTLSVYNLAWVGSY